MTSKIRNLSFFFLPLLPFLFCFVFRLVCLFFCFVFRFVFCFVFYFDCPSCTGDLKLFTEFPVENWGIRCFKWFSNVLLRLKPNSPFIFS